MAECYISGRMLAPSEAENQLPCACIFHPVSRIQGPTSTFPSVINRAELGQISMKTSICAPTSPRPAYVRKSADNGLKSSSLSQVITCSDYHSLANFPSHLRGPLTSTPISVRGRNRVFPAVPSASRSPRS